MGQSSKKKRRGGGRGGKRSKGRTPLTDYSFSGEESDLITEEITALCAIFQEDCKVVTGPSPQVTIKLKPYSNDMGFEDRDVSALLSVKYLPGYPYKCPKLLITPERGLEKGDTEKLLSLLHEQANYNARDGRIMIFNLAEAAQEFLSEIVTIGESNESVGCSHTASTSQLLPDKITSNEKKGPYVYGYIDLFSGSGELWSWSFDMDEKLNSQAQPLVAESLKLGTVQEKKLDKVQNLLTRQNSKRGELLSPSSNLGTLEEETEGDSQSINSSNSRSPIVQRNEDGNEGEKQREVLITGLDSILTSDVAEGDDHGSESEPSEWSFASFSNEQESQTTDRDIMMVHLLHLACAPKGPLADALPKLASELYNLGILSKAALDLASKPSSTFHKKFETAFQEQMNATSFSQFWTASDFGGSASSQLSSRYLNDFEELKPLGHGGFGHVVLCKNKLDGRHYAVKKIRLKDKILPVNDRILREVATLSRLQHQHVVRYYQAWYEIGVSDSYGEAAWGSMTPLSSTFSYKGVSATDAEHENKMESTYLYIQMEYCPRTLRQVFESYTHFDKELAWHLFHQIVEGLAHIHGQGIIHRDLTPSNIFFDARNDIKIGDFGLAKFLKLEQLDQDVGVPLDTTGVSIDGTGQVGTYFYTAPEIEQGWPKIDEKADMYSLGIVFFELWHPFATAMERHVVLSDLKQKGDLPAAWVAEFSEQASLLRRLMSQSPSERPSALELLQHAFPPRMEYQLLDNILRTMKLSEDSSIYDRVVNAIFDEETLVMKDDRHDCITATIQYTDLGTEVRDHVIDATREMFRLHCAKHLEISSMYLLDGSTQINRNTVKLLSHGGDILELCHELRLPFLNWLVSSQKSSFKRYDISYVYRRAIGHSPPNRYLQGDFDIIGGTSALTEAEVIKVTVDVISYYFNSDSCDIHLNHGDLLNAIWSWVGVKAEHRHKVAELLSMMVSLRPQSSERKSKWVVIRRQLLQELKLAQAVVNRLQTVVFRFCGAVDQALPRLRGALPTDKPMRKALDELLNLFNYLRVWRLETNVYIDALMSPTEGYHRDIFFQVYLTKENNPGSHPEGALLAIGGRYDYLLQQMWSRSYKSSPPGGVGTSIALETIIQQSALDLKPIRNEGSTSVLICSRGGGGLLLERMELVVELWEEKIKAQLVPTPDPSFTEQYEYANEHDIKCLVIITDSGVSNTGSVKVRHLELKKEKEVERTSIVKFLQEAMANQFKNPLIWN
ncbi:eIF-2-alpha kinase GCN2 isoform X1 [Cucumis melo]|uniref:non-specific serine/threonine protein kinase n=2 Tax=Cucumis melo TaxID=3656 RepID=A0A1S3BE99_CUCME|nr:eIF-2-alpha kinase GCN2 isoform X1 [Cucumis melo]